MLRRFFQLSFSQTGEIIYCISRRLDCAALLYINASLKVVFNKYLTFFEECTIIDILLYFDFEVQAFICIKVKRPSNCIERMKIMAQEILLTAEAYKKKNDELEHLKTVGRDEIAERIKEARSFGDLSENSEYDEALNDQAKMEAKIAQLENEMKNAKILDESAITTEAIHVGSKVKIRDVEYGDIEEYKILGESQANPDEGIISDQSAVGKALIGNKVGDVVNVNLPNGNVIAFEVLEISI